MKRILSILAFASIACTPAFAQRMEPQNLDIISLERGVVFNISIEKIGQQTLRFVGRKGSPLGASNVGIIDVGVKEGKRIAAPKSFTVPAPTVFGAGYTGTPDLHIYAGWNSVTGVRMCVSDLSTLKTKGLVATGNSGFVVCDGSVSSTDPLRYLGKVTYAVSTLTLGAVYTEVLP